MYSNDCQGIKIKFYDAIITVDENTNKGNMLIKIGLFSKFVLAFFIQKGELRLSLDIVH